MQPPPAEPGMHVTEVDTPALLLDLDAFEANLDLWRRPWRPPRQSCGRTPRRINRR